MPEVHSSPVLLSPVLLITWMLVLPLGQLCLNVLSRCLQSRAAEGIRKQGTVAMIAAKRTGTMVTSEKKESADIESASMRESPNVKNIAREGANVHRLHQ